ncbi:OLC1v1014343C1 [Oldenlandia corymbosa var. corymbosa]|uniref:OLC1v1014343C1 n=1 Tax=Oldenlandia corymbosa var. corymbosa TaxID=529605 RepID=A0AAV1E0M3_OLDCO|nr:OLC1v1014343C1 [Oldenlandia corymbosa var. corymbosa]
MAEEPDEVDDEYSDEEAELDEGEPDEGDDEYSNEEADEVGMNAYSCDGECRFFVLNCILHEKKKQPELLLSTSGKVISCDMNNNQVKEIANGTLQNDGRRCGEDEATWYEAFEYVETFVLFKTCVCVYLIGFISLRCYH